MKRHLLYLLLLSCLPLAANENIQGWCSVGASPIVAPTSFGGSPALQYFQQSYPNCQVDVYITESGGMHATIYNSVGSTVTNPFQANQFGYWNFYAANGTVDVQISGGGLPAPFTFGAITAFDPSTLSVSFSQITSGTSAAGTTFSVGSGSTLTTVIGSTIFFADSLNTFPATVDTTTNIIGRGCSTGQVAFAYDATAGQNFFLCTSTNIWTQQLNSGSTTFQTLGSGTNVSSAFVLGTSSSLATTGAGYVDFSSGGLTKPIVVAPAATITALSCTTGQLGFASDATAGQELYMCKGGAWTQQLNSGGSGGTAFGSISGGTNTSASMIVSTGASIKPGGSGQIWGTMLVDEANSNLPVIEVGGFAAATDYILCQNAITSNPKVACSAQGTDSAIDFVFTGKGTGRVYVNSIAAYFDNAGNLTVNNCTGCGGGGGGSPPFSDSLSLVKGNSDATKQFKIDTSTNVPTGTIVTGAAPGGINFTFAGINLTQTFSQTNTFTGAINSTGGLNVSGTTPSFSNGLNVSGTAALTALSVSAGSTFSALATFNGGASIGGSTVTIDPSTLILSGNIDASVSSTSGLGVGTGCSGGACSNGWTTGYQQMTLEQSSHVSLAMGNGAFFLSAPTSNATAMTANMNGACSLTLAGAHTIVLNCATGVITVDGTPITVP